MSSDGRLGKGTKLYIGDDEVDGDVATWTVIPQLMDVDPIEQERKEVDITNQDSPNKTKEYIPALKDGSDVSFEYLWASEIEATLRGFLGVGRRAMRLVYPKSDGTEPDSETDNPAEKFVGFVKKVTSPKAPVEDKMTAEFSVRIAGTVEQVEET